MLKHFLSCLLLLLTVQMGFSQYQVGHTTITFNDVSRSGGFGSGGGPGRQIQTEIYYPAGVAGNDVTLANGDFPVIVFGHGFAMVWSAYQNIWESLVPEGFIIAFPRTEGSLLPAPSHNDFALDLALVGNKLLLEDGINTSLFYQHVLPKVGLMGHSMGGGSAFIAAANNPNIETVIGLAPAETSPSAISAATNVTVDGLVLSGSSDGVTPPNSNHLPIYNNLASACKTYVSITNGSHCYFANSNFNCDFGEFFPGSLSRGNQQSIALNYMLPWLDFKLKNDCSAFLSFQQDIQTATNITYLQNCNINIVAPDSLSFDTAICAGDFYIAETGVSYNSSGLYFDTLLNYLGCDSLYYSLDLLVRNQDTVLNSSLSCSPLDTGVFVAINTNQYGCDSVFISTISLANVTSENVNIAGCDSIEVLGMWYDADTTIQDTLANAAQNGCDSVVFYQLDILSEAMSVDSTFLCDGDSLLLSDGTLVITGGAYSFNQPGSNGCDSTHVLWVETIPQITTTGIVGIDTAMIGDTIDYILDNYTFGDLVFTDVVGGYIVTDTILDLITVNWLNAGERTIEVTVFNEACSVNYLLTVYVLDPTGVQDIDNSPFTVYPNPIENDILIENLMPLSQVNLYDIRGSLLISEQANEPSLTLSVSHLSPALIFLLSIAGW